MTDGVILMTAMPVTKGHEYLIRWASEYLDTFNKGTCKLTVIVSGRSFEPIDFWERHAAIVHIAASCSNVVVRPHFDSSAPQVPPNTPDGDIEFWNYWRDVIHNTGNVPDGSLVFASELYGEKLAEIINGTFVPCDIARQIIEVSGTQVRKDMIANFGHMTPAMQRALRKNITIFGAESCGKTTIAKHLAKKFNGQFVPEWAREYLETIGAEVTKEKMISICNGQHASMVISREMFVNRPFTFYDTDLYSTIGYYKLWKKEKIPVELISTAYQTASDMYFIMNSNIPFEEDVLRYGGNVRESTDQFWVDICEQYGLPYHYVTSTTIEGRTDEIYQVLMKLTSFDKIAKFERET